MVLTAMATTVATTIAVAAAVAAWSGFGTATAVAAIAAVATVMTCMATAAAAATTKHTGFCFLFAAQQGESHDRDEARDAQNQRAIHLESSFKVSERKGPLSVLTCRLTSFLPAVTASSGAKPHHVRPAAKCKHQGLRDRC